MPYAIHGTVTPFTMSTPTKPTFNGHYFLAELERSEPETARNFTRIMRAHSSSADTLSAEEAQEYLTLARANTATQKQSALMQHCA